MIKYIHIVLAIWILAVAVPIGFSESFDARPTETEMEGVVISGTQCARGVNERCWATQYQTNPVAYHVTAPFTNTAGFYLDQNLMGTMAANIGSLVQYYVDPDTAYDGTTSISMLTVSGLWVDLDIGDHVSKFTQTFASGTNSAVYGDSPWRIYEENLDERYKVLNALEILPISCLPGATNFGISATVSYYGYLQYYGSEDPLGGIYYSVNWGGSDGYLGGNGTYNITWDNRMCGGAAGRRIIALGMSRVGGSNLGEIIIDVLEATENVHFNVAAEITFGSPAYIEVLGIQCVQEVSAHSHSESHTSSKVTVSGDLHEDTASILTWNFPVIIRNPFSY